MVASSSSSQAAPASLPLLPELLERDATGIFYQKTGVIPSSQGPLPSGLVGRWPLHRQLGLRSYELLHDYQHIEKRL